MLELAMAVAAVVLMYRIAEMDTGSGTLWGVITALACVIAVFTIPLPFIRIAVVVVAVFVAMFIRRLVTNL